MHTAAPRPVTNDREGVVHRWILHWGDEHLPREEHLAFQNGRQILGMSLEGLIADLQIAFTSFSHDLEVNTVLQTNFDLITAGLEVAEMGSLKKSTNTPTPGKPLSKNHRTKV